MRYVFLLAAVLVASSTQAQTRSVLVKHTPDGFVLADVPDAPLAGSDSAVLLTAPADGSGGWTMRTLRPGENPSDALVALRGDVTEVRAHHEMALALQREGADRSRILHDYHRDRIARRRAQTDDIGAGEIIQILDDADVRGGESLDAEVTRLTNTARGLLRSIQVSDRGPLAVRHELTAELDEALGLDDPIVAALVADEALYSLDISDSGDRTSIEIVFGFETQGAWEAWLSQPASTEALLTLRERATDSKVRTHVRAGLR